MNRSSRPSDTELDRALASGRPAGPELDHVWARVQRTRSHARLRAWVRRASLVLVPAAAATAALALWLAPPLAPRGQAATTTPVVDATCGAATSPCRVGQPAHLRVHGGDVPGTFVVLLEKRLVAGPTQIPAGDVVTLPIAVIPEADDVASGLTFELRFLANGSDDHDPRTASDAQTRAFTFAVAPAAP